METHRTVWTALKASKPVDLSEALRPYRAVLEEYARGKGLSAGETEEAVRQALETLPLLTTLDPAKVGFRPLLHALLSQAIRTRRGWSSIREKEEAPVLEVTSSADGGFDRLWRLHLVRGATQELSRETPALAQALAAPAGPGLADAEGRLGELLERAVRAYTVTAEQWASEVQALSRAPIEGEMDDLARRLFSGLGAKRSPLRIARFRVGIAGFAGLVLLAGIVVAWTSCELRVEREARAREREEAHLAHQAELAIERAAAFVFEGGDVSRHHQELQRAVDVLGRLRPGSPALGRAPALRVGAALDPALAREAMAAIGSRPEGAPLAWDHWVYRAIRREVWAEPVGGSRPAAGQGRRAEADAALLAGEDERALDLYMELQLVRPGDPLVWLGGALAAFRAGSPSAGGRFARRAAELLELGEGHAVARALEGLCFEKLGREEERASAFQASARRAGGNAFARALVSRPAQGPGAPELPRRSGRALLFEAAGEPAPAALEAALEMVRQRLQSADLLPGGDLKWDPDARTLRVSLAESRPESAQATEWLVVRRGVFGARDLAPRSLNDQWRHPSTPAGHQWAPINLFYPGVPEAAGRYRLVKQEAPLLAREDLTVSYEASQGRLVWSCQDPRVLPAGAGLALLLDGEIFWYGRVGEPRSGFLVVGPEDPQAMIPLLLRYGPLPVQFVRRG